LFSFSDKSEREIQWLNDVGFTNIAKKIRGSYLSISITFAAELIDKFVIPSFQSLD